MSTKYVYFFNVLTYTNDFDYVIKSKKEVKIIRTNVYSAIDYIKSKYPKNQGFYVELFNSCSLLSYQHNKMIWFEYLAK